MAGRYVIKPEKKKSGRQIVRKLLVEQHLWRESFI